MRKVAIIVGILVIVIVGALLIFVATFDVNQYRGTIQAQLQQHLGRSVNLGDMHSAYAKMGSPRYPTQAQIRELRKAAELAAPESRNLRNGELTLTLPSYGLALLTLQ